jgi:predicted PurR-regulated permease PerM
MWLAVQIKDIIFMTFIAYIISVGLNKGIDKLEKKFKLPRLLSTILVYFVFVAVISIFLAFIVPPLLRELSNLFNNLQLPVVFQSQINSFEVNLTSIKGLLDTFGASISTAFNIVSSTFSSALVTISTVVIALYFSLEKPQLAKGLETLFDEKRAAQMKTFFREIDYQLGNWIRSEFILMTVIGLLTFLGLLLIKIPYALPLAIVAGLLEIVPNIGPILSAVPAIAVALFTFGWPTAVGTTILYLVVQQLENNLIVPRIMKTNVNINPLVSILGILIGAKIFGVIGALLAIPIFIVARTAYATWKKNVQA